MNHHSYGNEKRKDSKDWFTQARQTLGQPTFDAGTLTWPLQL